jgi:hypothetical protein
VYDFSAGKLDWISAGLPTEGMLTAVPRAGDLSRAFRSVPTSTVCISCRIP